MNVLNIAVFMDRDGVLTENDQSMIDGPFFVTHPSQLIFRPGGLIACNRLLVANLPLFLVSSQVWVNTPHREEMLGAIHTKLCDTVLGVGGRILESRYILGDGKLQPRSTKAEAIKDVAEGFSIDLPSSYMIGDSVGDMEAGRENGMRLIYIRNEYAETDIATMSSEMCFLSVLAAVERIIQEVEHNE